MTGRQITFVLGVVALGLLVAGCGDLTSRPSRTAAVGTTSTCSTSVPAGAHLFLISNVGRTVRVLGLAGGQLLPDPCVLPDFDPVGPWFSGGEGYYLSRVDGSGAGANALVEFDPHTLALTGRRLSFPSGSNPNSMLVLPSPPAPAGVAWVALRGSTFDSFATNGLVVVDMDTLRDRAYCDLNKDSDTCPALAPALGGDLTSLLGFVWDGGGCGGTGCAYAVVNNWKNAVRSGWLLVLQPDAAGLPVLRDAVPLGRNPLLEMTLDAARGTLWVVNNGGYVSFCTAACAGAPGNLQVLDTAALADGVTGNETVAWLAPTGACPADTQGAPCQAYDDFPVDPTGIFPFDAGTGWVTTFPNDVVRTVDLAARTLAPLPASPLHLSGPLFPTSAGLYTGLGGNSFARLARLDTATGAMAQTYDLEAGNGPLSGAEYDVP